MATKRKMTPLRAASETRASAKKQAKAHFSVFRSWVEALADQAEDLERSARTLRSTVTRAQKDLTEYERREMAYFSGQRNRQKALKGGL